MGFCFLQPSSFASESKNKSGPPRLSVPAKVCMSGSRVMTREQQSIIQTSSLPLAPPFCHSCVPTRGEHNTDTSTPFPFALSLHRCLLLYLPVPEVEVVTGFSACREKLSGSPRFALGGIGGADRDPPPPPPLLPPPLPLLAVVSATCGCGAVTAEARIE